MSDFDSADSISGEMELERMATENIAQMSSGQTAQLDEERDRALFMHSVNRYMMETGKPLSKIPIMGYKELDLYQLFKEVVARGGFNEVVRRVGTWSKIWKRLSNFDPSITDSSFRLKKNYERYLLDYEYHMYPSHRRSNEGSNEWADQSPVGIHKRSLKKKGRKGRVGLEMPKPSSAPRLRLVLDNGELTIERLGEVINRSPFVTDKHVWPVGFCSVRIFASMKNPSVNVPYSCQIVDGGGRPQFVVTAEDQPESPVVSHSPSAAWRIVLKRISENAEAQQQPRPGSPTDLPESPNFDKLSMSVDTLAKGERVRGTLQFGLAHPVVSQLVKEMLKQSPAPYTSARSFSTLKKRSSEMCLKDLQGSDSEGSLYTPEPSRRQPRRKCVPQSFNVEDGEEEDMMDEDMALMESGAIATLVSWQFMKADSQEAY